MNLSVIILSKNEEKNIKKAIDSVGFSDEIILIDDNSIDETTRAARDLGAKVYTRSLGGDFSAQRNFALRQARGSWVLFLDADERVTAELKNEIIQAINDPLRDKEAYYLKRQDVFFGKKMGYGEVGKAKFVRLAKRNSGKWKRRVHEVWEIKGKIGELKNPLLHYPHPSLKEFISDINTASSLHAEANAGEAKKSSLFKIVFWPKLKFINNYLVKRGFLDGTHGFILALLMSFHSFLAWSKLWFLQARSGKN